MVEKTNIKFSHGRVISVVVFFGITIVDVIVIVDFQFLISPGRAEL